MGAGPGGSAAAYHLARHGVDVLMVDKATFPREKVCGDGLTPRAVKAHAGHGDRHRRPRRSPGQRSCARTGPTARHVDLPWPTLRVVPGLRARHVPVRPRPHARAARGQGRRARSSRASRRPSRRRGGRLGHGRAAERRRRQRARGSRPVRRSPPTAPRRASAARLGVTRDPHGRSASPRAATTGAPALRAVLESFLNLPGGDGFMPGYGWIFFLPDGVLNVGAGLLSTFAVPGPSGAAGVRRVRHRRCRPSGASPRRTRSAR